MLLLEVDTELLYEPRLQFLYASKAFFLHTAQAVGIVSPLLGRTFITADVNILVRENLCHIVQHTLQEVDDLVLTDVEHVVRDAAVDAYAILLVGVATEFGVRCHCCHHMAGQVDLRHNFDMAFGCVSYDFLQVFLRVPHAAAILSIVVESCTVARIAERTATDGADFCQFGVFGDFDTPALVVGQVPVETVYLIECHDVKDAFHFFLVKIVASNIQHIAAVTQCGLVGDVYIRHGPACVGCAA